MGAPMLQWRHEEDLGSLPMNSDCVVEARYWSRGTQILCRVNHSQMARIREAKGLMELPTRNVCLPFAAAGPGACHFDGSRGRHGHDVDPAAARPAAFPFPGALALIR
jgi:hypothetical protein